MLYLLAVPVLSINYLLFLITGCIVRYFVLQLYKTVYRFMSFGLGVGLSLAPIGAYLAVTGKFDLLPFYFHLLFYFG